MFIIIRTPGSYGYGVRMVRSAGANRGTVDVDVDGLSADYRPGHILPGRVSVQASNSGIRGGGFARLAYDPSPSGRLAILVLHDGDFGTWHGAGLATIEPGCAESDGGYGRCRGRASSHIPGQGHTFLPGPRRVWIDPHPGERWLAESGSGAGEFVAGIWLLEPDSQPLVIKTSGYRGRRDWMITTIRLDGSVVVQSNAEYLAAAAPPVVLG